MGKLQDLTGQRINRWTVLERAPNTGLGHLRWVCRCDCGVEKLVKGNHLRSGASKSCGCYSSEVTTSRSLKHGANRRGQRSTEYGIWCGMRRRCHDEKDSLYVYYGARGISVCERWRNSFSAFLADVGPRPGPEYSLDRKDNERGYEPGNVRWATDTEQANNKRTNVLIERDGRVLSLRMWCRELQLNYGTVHSRIRKYGMSPEAALDKGREGCRS